GPDRVGYLNKHDWRGAGRLSQRRHGCVARGQDHVGRERDQFGREGAHAVGIGRGPARVNAQVATDGPTQLPQRLLERLNAGPITFRIVCGRGHEHPEAPHTLARLCTYGERPCRGAANRRDELAAFHSMTSSARASSMSGTVGPSALAVLRLIPSSYLVGACPGRSAGFSPLRMRST